MTTATLVQRVPLPLRSPPLRAGVVAFGVTLAVAIVLLASVSTAIAALHDGRVLRGVTVAGVPIGGLDRAAAEERLRVSLPRLGSASLSLVSDREPVEIFAAELGRDYDLAATLDSAFAVGREGTPLTSSAALLRSLVDETSLAPVVVPLEPIAFDRLAEKLSALLEREAVDAEVLTDGAAGLFGVRLAVDEVVLDRDALLALLTEQLSLVSGNDLVLEVPVITSPPEFTTREAAAAALAGNRLAAEIGLEIESDVYPIERASLMGWVSFEEGAYGTLVPVLDKEAASEAMVALAATLNREAKDASFEYGKSGGPTGVVPGQSGREIDVEASTEALLSALARRSQGERVPTVPLAGTLTLPELSTETAEAALPQMELVSTWTTYYVSGPSNFWSNNISIPAWDIDGTTLAPGEWFDFWRRIGPVTTARGYGMGGVIINGRTQLTGALAGGICSTSTTLFNTAARAGLEIGDRRNHSYYISRYPVGLDATVYTDATWTQSMTFRNDTDVPLLIRAYAAPGWVRFDIWMAPTGREVVLTKPVTWGYRSAVWTTQVDDSLAPGQRRVEQEPHDGFNAQVARFVYDADGNQIHHDTWVSNYRVVNGIVMVGPEPEAEEPPA
jgi:vancomycin resistance protein YoaR